MPTGATTVWKPLSASSRQGLLERFLLLWSSRSNIVVPTLTLLSVLLALSVGEYGPTITET